jgi:hypothetical protein
MSHAQAQYETRLSAGENPATTGVTKLRYMFGFSSLPHPSVKPTLFRFCLLATTRLLLALAILGLAPAPQAVAAIDAGVQGNGELFFNLWDCTRSYTRDLDISIDAFEARLAEASPLALAWPADGLLKKYLAGVTDTGELRWNVVAVDGKGARRVLATYTPPATEMPPDADTGRRLAGTLQTRINEINLGLNGAGDFRNLDDDAQSVILKACQPGFAGNDISFGRQLSNKLGFDSSGGVGQHSPGTGLGFLRLDIAPIGLKPAVLHEYTQGGAPVRVWLDPDLGLHIGIAGAGEPGPVAQGQVE